MSKVSKITQKSISAQISSRSEAVGIAEVIINGKRTLSTKEAENLFTEAADNLDLQFRRMDHNMQAVALAELDISNHARAVISSCKNLAGQVGDSMARIDKVVVKDFDAKLNQLERFVAALKALDNLKRDGRLDSLLSAISGK